MATRHEGQRRFVDAEGEVGDALGVRLGGLMPRFLLDTHAFLWWLDGDKRLTPKPRRLIQSQDNQILVSAASVWEITTKARIAIPSTGC
jgi:hypothetical protein